MKQANHTSTLHASAQLWGKFCLPTHPWAKQYMLKAQSATHCQPLGKHGKGGERTKPVNNEYILPQLTPLVKNICFPLMQLNPSPPRDSKCLIQLFLQT